MRNWLGAGKHFLVFPVRAGELVNYVGFVKTDEPMKESWSAAGRIPPPLREAFAGWDPMVQAIIAQVKTMFRWGLYDREPLATWTRGRLTLLGDAAHPCCRTLARAPIRPSRTGSRSATVLSRADPASAPRALLIYEQLRRERTAGVQRISRVNGARYDAVSGDLDTRDRQLAAQPQERAWIWNYDAEAEASAAAASL